MIYSGGGAERTGVPGGKRQDGSEDAGLVKTALAYEERDRRLYRDASGKIPLPEVALFFRKMVEGKHKNIALLCSL